MFVFIPLIAAGTYFASGAVDDLADAWRGTGNAIVRFVLSAIIVVLGIAVVLSAGAAFLVKSGWVKATLGSVPTLFDSAANLWDKMLKGVADIIDKVIPG